MNHQILMKMIINISFDFILIYIVHCYFSAFFITRTKRSFKFFLIVYGAYCIASLALLFIDKSIYYSACSFLFLLAISHGYQAKQRERIICVMLFLLVMSCIEFISFGICRILTEIPTNPKEMDARTILTIKSYISVVSLVIVKSAAPYISHVREKRFGQIEWWHWVRIFAMPVISIITLFCLQKVASAVSEEYSWILIIVTLCIIFMNVLVFYLFDQLTVAGETKMDTALLAQRVNYYTAQNAQLEQNWLDVQRVRHDMKHLLFGFRETLSGSCDLKAQEVRREIESIIGEMDKTSVRFYTGIDSIDALLHYYSETAKSKHIFLDIVTRIDSTFAIPTTNLCVIMGNALDNAIEACEELKEKSRYITAQIAWTQDVFFLEVLNPTNQPTAFEQGYPTSTKQNKKEHGIGLKSIYYEVEKTNGFVHIDAALDKFSLQITLFPAENSP